MSQSHSTPPNFIHSLFDSIIRNALSKRKIVLTIALLLTIGGIFTLRGMPIDVLPNLNRPTVTVIIEAKGMAAQEVEAFITIPLEAGLSGGSGIKMIRSKTNRGVASVSAEFDWSIDPLVARQIVKEGVDKVTPNLPEGVDVHLAPMSSIMGEIQLVGLYSKSGSTDLSDLRTFAEWTLRRRLLGIPGVANVSVLGGAAKEYQIRLSASKLAKYDNSFAVNDRYINLSELTENLHGIGENTAGGFFVSEGREFTIRNIAGIRDVADLEQVVVGTRAGTPVLVRDIANVEVGYRPRRGDAGINGKPGVLIAIQKQPQVSTLELTEAIDLEIESLVKTKPADIVVVAEIFKQADFIQRSIDNIQDAIRDGAIIILIVIVLFLWNLRTALITLAALPLSLLTACLVFAGLGLEINTMTLGGLTIAVGELVDDAIVDMENIFRRLRENKSLGQPKPSLEVIFAASSEIRTSIVLATGTVILVFLPLFFLPGIEGRLFQPLAIAYVVAILSSLIIALTVTPVLCYYLLSQAKLGSQRETLLVRAIKLFQERNLRVLFSKPYISLGIIVLLFIGSLVLFKKLRVEFLPAFNEGTLTVFAAAPVGTALEKSMELAEPVEKTLLESPGVITVARRTGRAEGDEHAEGPNTTEIEIKIDPGSANTTKTDLVNDLRARLSKIEGVVIDIGQPLSHRIDHMMTGVRSEVAVFVYGEDLEVISYQAFLISQRLEKIQGIVDLKIENQDFAPELKIAIDYQKAGKYGLSAHELAEFLELALQGSSVGRVVEEGRVFEIRALFDNESRKTERLASMIVKYLPNGHPVRLGDVTEIYESSGPYEIKRDNASRRIAVQFNTSGRDLAEIVRDTEDALTSIELPEGYYTDIGGRYSSTQRAAKTMLLLGILSLLLITSMLYLNFRSRLVTFQILLNIPFSFIGAIVALYVTDTALSVASMVGFIALTGISARNGIMMISHYLHLMNEEDHLFSAELVIRGSLERLVPVSMTALCAILALAPVILSGPDTPGREILYPVALVISGGLLSATLLDIILTPVIFFHLASRSRILEKSKN